MQDKEFIESYGIVGFFLRQNDLDTSSRVAMLASLYHKQKEMGSVEFDTFYEFSLEKTNQKLEKSSFKSFITRLRKTLDTDDPLVIENDETFECTDYLITQLETAEKNFPSI